MDYTIFLPVIIAFALSAVMVAFDHSGAEKTENGSDRTRGWCEVSFEKSRNSDYGRSYDPA